MKHHALRDSLAITGTLVLLGLGACVAPEDAEDDPDTSTLESELGSGWWSPVVGNYQVICGSAAHVNGALYAADIAAAEGTPVHAAKDGVIQFAGMDTTGYGNLVKLASGGGTGKRHYYAHLKDIHTSVKGQIGATVIKGQLIGWVGKTGNVTGPHLHFHVQNPAGAGVNLIGMTVFTDNPSDPWYPSNNGVSHYNCAWIGR
jgi:murein DD-endopeptidase MepM/ murein hydrolase activator NlpD